MLPIDAAGGARTQEQARRWRLRLRLRPPNSMTTLSHSHSVAAAESGCHRHRRPHTWAQPSTTAMTSLASPYDGADVARPSPAATTAPVLPENMVLARCSITAPEQRQADSAGPSQSTHGMLSDQVSATRMGRRLRPADHCYLVLLRALLAQHDLQLARRLSLLQHAMPTRCQWSRACADGAQKPRLRENWV